MFGHFFSYFSSKLINPYRKCELYQDLSVKNSTKASKQKSYQLALNILEGKKIVKTFFNHKSPEIINHAAKMIGNLLADCFFDYKFTLPAERNDLIFKHLFSCDYKIEEANTLLENVLPINYKSLKKRVF